MNNKGLLLTLALVLIVIGITKPNLSFPINNPGTTVNNNIVIEEPTDPELLEAAEAVIGVLKTGPSDRTEDCLRLASLYIDMASLIGLDGESEIITSTENIRQANSLSGTLLHINLKGKYPQLAEAAKNVIVAGIGDDDVKLDTATRIKAIESFHALAWAFKEGAR